jgi:hypothetical protein
MEKMYNHEITRLNKSLLFTEDEESLFSLKADHLHRVSNDKVIQLFCNELRSMLSIETTLELFKRVESLGFYLESLREEDPDKVPSLGEFFKVLSPFMMRAIIENIESDEGREALHQGFQEALRIAIEEEIHIWQEKII